MIRSRAQLCRFIAEISLSYSVSSVPELVHTGWTWLQGPWHDLAGDLGVLENWGWIFVLSLQPNLENRVSEICEVDRKTENSIRILQP